MRTQRTHHGERGQVIPLVALAMIVLMSVTGVISNGSSKPRRTAPRSPARPNSHT
jgi:hypothetical protein